MTIRHHPGVETLARYAAATLPAGPAVVVAAHIALCPACRKTVADFECAGGAMLEALPPTPMLPEALARTLAAIDSDLPAAPVQSPQVPLPPALPGGAALPVPLQACAVGRWRWLAPGLRMSRVGVPGDATANVMLLRVGPNRKLPEHGHTGSEVTFVIAGSFSDGINRYFPGDLVEAGTDIHHQLVVEPGNECLCLAAIEGRMRPHSLVGRILQPLLGL